MMAWKFRNTISVSSVAIGHVKLTRVLRRSEISKLHFVYEADVQITEHQRVVEIR